MTSQENGSASTSNGITEDEAALYDRQIRLWGVEAQNRMRSASVLVVTLRGIATEVCKNVVLAGIGSLTILDDKDISEEDLGCGFFFREEEVGTKRVHAAKPRIHALNPRVELHAVTDMQELEQESFVSKFDLVVLTDSDKDTIERTNALCRKLGKKFYASSSYGLHGYIFADLLDHEWIIEKTEQAADRRPAESSSSVEAVKVSIKKAQTFVPFPTALQHSWKSLSPKKLRKVSPILWACLVLWEYQSRHQGSLPNSDTASDELKAIASEILPKRDVAPSLLPDMVLSSLASTAVAEFMPVCAIIGGVLGQDVLNALGGREPPVINLFTYDGFTGAGDFHQLGLVAQA